MAHPPEKVIAALRVVLEEMGTPGAALAAVVDASARRFDLDAAQSEWLLRRALEVRRQAAAQACPVCGGARQPADNAPGHLVCGSGHLSPAEPGR